MNNSHPKPEPHSVQQKIDDIEDDIISLLEFHRGLLPIKELYFYIFRFLFLAMPQDGICEGSKINFKAMEDATKLIRKNIEDKEMC